MLTNCVWLRFDGGAVSLGACAHGYVQRRSRPVSSLPSRTDALAQKLSFVAGASCCTICSRHDRGATKRSGSQYRQYAAAALEKPAAPERIVSLPTTHHSGPA